VRLRRSSARAGSRVLIVGYHHVVPDFERASQNVIPALVTGVATFEQQLSTIGRSYRFASLSEALDVLSERRTSDRDLCVVTFDDGYRSFLEHALPVLERLGIPATLYVPSGFIGNSVPLLHDRLYALLRMTHATLPASGFDVSGPVQVALGRALLDDPIAAVDRLLERSSPSVCVAIAEALERRLGVDPDLALDDSRPLSWDELRAVHAAGVEIGSHTVDHSCMHSELRSDAVRQLERSRSRLESELGTPVVHFSYPNGWYTPSAVEELQAAGYRSAVTTESRLNRLGENPFLLKRKAVWEFTSRGLRSFSPAVASCNFDDVFAALGVSPYVSGEKPDPVRPEGAALQS